MRKIFHRLIKAYSLVSVRNNHLLQCKKQLLASWYSQRTILLLYFKHANILSWIWVKKKSKGHSQITFIPITIIVQITIIVGRKNLDTQLFGNSQILWYLITYFECIKTSLERLTTWIIHFRNDFILLVYFTYRCHLTKNNITFLPSREFRLNEIRSRQVHSIWCEKQFLFHTIFIVSRKIIKLM